MNKILIVANHNWRHASNRYSYIFRCRQFISDLPLGLGTLLGQPRPVPCPLVDFPLRLGLGDVANGVANPVASDIDDSFCGAMGLNRFNNCWNLVWRNASIHKLAQYIGHAHANPHEVACVSRQIVYFVPIGLLSFN